MASHTSQWRVGLVLVAMGVTDGDSLLVGEGTGCWLRVKDLLAVADVAPERDTEPRTGIGTEFLNRRTAITGGRLEH